MDKVSNLNEVILNLRQQLKKKNFDNSQVDFYKEKLGLLNNTVTELKLRLKITEENSQRKDKLAESMRKSLELVKESIKDVEDRNNSHLQERELLKGALSHVLFGLISLTFYFSCAR